LQLPWRGRLRGQAAVRDALRVRRSSGEGGRAPRTPVMPAPRSDALVLFGATGDLAHKKIFPARQALLKRGHLDARILGIARAPGNVETFRADIRESLEKSARHAP